MRVNLTTMALWKVTLGFLPFYANLQKRLLHDKEEGLEDAKERGTQTIAKKLNEPSLDIQEILTSDSTYWSNNCPGDEWSDISESSTEISVNEWSPQSESTGSRVSIASCSNSTKTTTSESEHPSVQTYSGSEWKFAWPGTPSGAGDVVSLDSLSYSDSAEASSTSTGSGSSYYSALSSPYSKYSDANDLSWVDTVAKVFYDCGDI